ncbi:MAG: TRAP-type C4-dicarboxylate transport system, periplasmic component [Devosia sp.]|nr:TRAP-type C4-dicarboxylate transport system, periplasmic component [Devosia sp.]
MSLFKQLTAAGATAVVMATCALTVPAFAQTTIRIPHCCAENSHFNVAAQRFADLLAEKSSGQLAGQVFAGGQLGQETEVIQNVQMGAIEATIIGHDPLAQFATETTILSLPYLFDDHDQAFELLDGELGSRLEELLSAKGLRVLAWGNNGARVYTNNRQPLNSPEDFAGLKLRSPQNPVNLAITESFGGIPIAMPYGEVYTGLQQGTIDGQENAVINIYPARLQEVQKYMSETNHLLSFVVLVMNENLYSSMSAELQQVIEEAADQAMTEERAAAQQLAAEMTKKMEEEGVEINKPDLTALREVTRPIHEQYIGKSFPQELYDLVAANR